MRTDRELLELAAKAAGINLEWDGDPTGWAPMYYEGKTYHVWNPLTDDGDALRLAAKLKLGITFGVGVTGCVRVWRNADWMQGNYSGDPCAATRRAIVRAAAQIARELEAA